MECFFSNNLFYDNDPESLYFPHDAHLNAKGHQTLANVLKKELTNWIMQPMELPTIQEHKE